MITTKQSALTVTEAARVLGVHSQTVRRLVHTGRLPALRLGAPPHGHIRVTAAALDEFMNGGPGSTATDLEETHR